MGPKTRTALLKTLGSVDGIRRATDIEVLAVKGVSKKHLEVLRKYLGREGEDADDGVVDDTAPETEGALVPDESGAHSEPKESTAPALPSSPLGDPPSSE